MTKAPFSKSEKEEESEFVEIYGTFACQTCDKICDVAKYGPMSKILTWKCENGHKSYIEGFTL
jgi:hypothetical protein